MKTIKIFMTALISIASVIATTVTGANFASAKEKKLSDFSELELMALSKGYSVVCDHDGDGRIDLTDLSYEKMLIVGEIPTTPGIELFGRSVVMGDLNYDEKVNAADAALFSALIAKKMTCEDIFLPKETEPAVTTTVTTATTPAVTTTVETTTEPVVTTTVVTTTEPAVTTTVVTTTEPVVTTQEAPSLDVGTIVNPLTVTFKPTTIKDNDYWYFPGTNEPEGCDINNQYDCVMASISASKLHLMKYTTITNREMYIPELGNDKYTILLSKMTFNNPKGTVVTGTFTRLISNGQTIATHSAFVLIDEEGKETYDAHDYYSDGITETETAILAYAGYAAEYWDVFKL